MSTKPTKTVKQNTGADLRALAEARLSAQAGPKAEASRRADVIRAGLSGYAATMEKIAEAYRREDWKALGYESFNAYAGGEFGEARLKLTPEQRAQILPAFLAVGMSKRGAAAALGVDDKTIRNDLRGADNSAPKKKSPLVNAMRQAIENAQTAAADLPEVAADGGEGALTAPEDPSASGPSAPPPADGPDVTPELVHLVSQFRPQTAPECAIGDGKTIGGAARTTCPVCLAWLAGRDGWKWSHGSSKAHPGDPACERCGRELDPGIVKAAQMRCLTCDPDRLHYAVEAGGACEPCAEDSAAAPSEAASAPAGRPLDPDGPEVVPTVAVDQPGIDHPRVGEAPAHASVPAAGAQPLPVVGKAPGGDEVEGEDDPASDSSSTDPAAIVGDFQAFVRRVDDTYDADVAGPLCTEEQMTALHTAVDDLAQFVGLLERWRTP